MSSSLSAAAARRVHTAGVGPRFSQPVSALSAAAARRVHTAGVGPRFSQPVSETLVRHILIC